MVRRWHACLAVLLLVGLAACGPADNAQKPAVRKPAPVVRANTSGDPAQRLEDAADIDGEKIIHADDTPGDWLTHGRTYSEQRFSPLTDINRDTVKQLGVAWEFRTNTVRGLEATPIVSNGIMFVTGSWSKVWALDARNGRQLWRFYVVPGDPKLPPEDKAMADALKTWSDGGTTNKWWEQGGGGTPWDSMAFDPELDLIYLGTGNGSAWNRNLRSPGGGDNLYLSSIVALKPETGELVWYYQTTPGDDWDYTATQHIVLADIMIGGVMRKVLLQAPKNGFFYVIDRASGKLISAWPFTAIP